MKLVQQNGSHTLCTVYSVQMHYRNNKTEYKKNIIRKCDKFDKRNSARTKCL